MPQTKTIAPIVLALASAICGCADEPQPRDFSANYRIILFEGEPEGRALAYFREGRGPLPDPEGGALSLNGNTMALLFDPEEPNSRWVFTGNPPRLEAGGGYEFVFEMPGAEPITHTVAMVQPGELTAPTVGTEVSLQEDLAVTWSESVPGETDWIAFRFREAGFTGFGDFTAVSPDRPEHSLSTRASDGQASVSVRADVIRRTYEAAVASRDGGGGPVEPGAPPLAVELVLARARSAPSSPPFQGGSISLLAEVSSIPVILVP